MFDPRLALFDADTSESCSLGIIFSLSQDPTSLHLDIDSRRTEALDQFYLTVIGLGLVYHNPVV